MTSALPLLDEAEIVVVGGGPAGAIAAFTLASTGHDVALIDRESFPRDKACGDGLTSSAVSFLAELGIAHVVSAASPIEGTRLVVDWEPRETKRASWYNTRGRGQACCIPRLVLDDSLIKVAIEAGARLLRATVTEPILVDGSVVGVEVTNEGAPARVLARRLIAADGATSRLRRQLLDPPSPRAAYSYAVRRYVRTDEPLEQVFDIYAPVADSLAGYGWVFPVSARLANVGIGYVTARGLLRPRPITDLLDWFLASLQQHRGDELGALVPLAPPRGGALGVNFSVDGCEVAGVTFVGDAARVCDPITGEGIDQAMRSAHAGALALHDAIRRGPGSVGIGRVMARSNPRLGQDSAMIARLAHELLKRRHPKEPGSTEAPSSASPLFSAARAMLTAEVDYASMAATAAGRAASRHGGAEILATLDDRIRDQVRSRFILVGEMLQREVCSGMGPLGALTVLATQGACGVQAGDDSVEAALSVELLRVFPRMLSRVAPAGDDQAKANNALAVMTADYGLSRASAAAAALGSDCAAWLADAIEANSEAVALLVQDQFDTGRSAQRYIGWARLSTGASISLAARLGAHLGRAEESVTEAIAAAGETLGIAVQICEDTLVMARADAVTGRRPRHVLEEGHFSLPVILAIEEDPGLAAALGSGLDAAEIDLLWDRIGAGRGLERAAEMCQEYADAAKAATVRALGEHNPVLAACDVPCACLKELGLVRAGAQGLARTPAPSDWRRAS